MTAAENAPQRSFTAGQLTLTGLVLLIIGIVGGGLYFKLGPPTAGNGSDTPIVIVGGSIHFKAKKSDWQPCSNGNTTCYMATSKMADKKKLRNFHFVDEDSNDSPLPVTAASGYGWEIDVTDANKQLIRVCAEISSDYTACDNKDPIKSDYIYVINTGAGRFHPPSGKNGKHNRLIYEDKNGQQNYAYITTIQLNASGRSPTTKSCTDSDCSIYLSQ